MPDVPYLITLTRSQSSLVEVCPIAFQDQLPVLPIPLRPPDADVALYLGLALTAVYDEAAYDLSIDYEQVPPPPTLSEAELDWVQIVRSGSKRFPLIPG